MAELAILMTDTWQSGASWCRRCRGRSWQVWRSWKLGDDGDCGGAEGDVEVMMAVSVERGNGDRERWGRWRSCQRQEPW
jgi:hypothetical protein